MREKATKQKAPKTPSACIKCGHTDFYNTVAGFACWECDSLQEVQNG